ncbi:YciI family protein [Thalassotalea sp. 1_MG-2023]|uniref:YciI family protein n=1 Tax=Thalassotalea sp. 1_MG-2023 TaxID=3062680 RepID=UPI0026E3490A|nr:YciI family protein [Thalassotalea sp. 1_MG-2023]MDO6427122.1 YciI family protein [Thalassotalea sp. 1_MG-2023]
MKYLCLVYYDETKMGNLSQTQWDDLNQECIACVEGLTTAGNFIDGAPLMTTDTALSVRIRDDKPLITDGPFAETKEQLAGFYMLEARDMNDALRLAQKIPPARYGTVEVRPVRELKHDGNDR